MPADTSVPADAGTPRPDAEGADAPAPAVDNAADPTQP